MSFNFVSDDSEIKCAIIFYHIENIGKTHRYIDRVLLAMCLCEFPTVLYVVN